MSTHKCNKNIKPYLLLFSLLLPLLMQSAARAQHTRYHNTVNTKFATKSDGPQSALIVDVAANATEKEVSEKINTQARADWDSRQKAMRAQLSTWQQRGLLKRGSILPVSTIIAVRRDGRLVIPPRNITRAVGGGTLTFKFTGFAANDESYLKGLVALFYPIIGDLYSAPSWSGQVEVVNAGFRDGGTATDVQRLAFGAYDVSNARILLPLYQSTDSLAQSLLLNMIHAFHGPAVFQYDAWEQGFARAAAAVIGRNANVQAPDPTANNLFSILRFYDLMNQPALGNSTFFPPSQANLSLDAQFGIGKMLTPRLGMSGAVWLKAYIENPNFFHQFNDAYYAQFTAPLAGDVPSLKVIAAGVLPQIEGLPFNDWFVRQYILDTSVTPGSKLFAYLLPGIINTTDKSQSDSITLVYYRTNANGDETLLNDRAYATYFDSTDARITAGNLGGASEQATITDGEGFFTTLFFPNKGYDDGRVTADFHVGKDNARVYIPVGLSGDLKTVVLGVQDGTYAVQTSTTPSNAVRNASGTIARGAFGATLGVTGGDLGRTTVGVTIAGVTVNYRINTGDALVTGTAPEDQSIFYAVIRPAGQGSVKTVTKSFVTAALPYLVSFPVEPLSPAVDQALSLKPLDFLLSYYDSTRGSYETYAAGQQNISKLSVGRGYWLKMVPQLGITTQTVVMTGVAPPLDTDLTISAPFGWVLIGTGFEQQIPLSKLLVQYLQNDAVTWEDAVAKNYVAAQPYAFDPTTGAYKTVDTLLGDQWQGYFIRVLVPAGVAILVPGPQAISSRAVPTGKAATIPKPVWSLTLRAVQGTDPGDTAEATLGMADGASRAFDNRYDREQPPAVTSQMQIAFPHTDWGNASGNYFADYHADSRSVAGETWDFTVTPSKPGQTVLTWNGLRNIARNIRLILIDKASGERIPLANRSSYGWTADASHGLVSRKFQIVATTGSSHGLTIGAITTQPTRGTATSAVIIGYAVSDTATVTTEIVTSGGKVVARPGGSRSVVAGQQTVRWDGRNESGNALPAGSYTMKITARAEDGTTVVQQRPILLVR